jgi:hypothetical protein
MWGVWTLDQNMENWFYILYINLIICRRFYTRLYLIIHLCLPHPPPPSVSLLWCVLTPWRNPGTSRNRSQFELVKSPSRDNPHFPRTKWRLRLAFLNLAVQLGDGGHLHTAPRFRKMRVCKASLTHTHTHNASGTMGEIQNSGPIRSWKGRIVFCITSRKAKEANPSLF